MDSLKAGHSATRCTNKMTLQLFHTYLCRLPLCAVPPPGICYLGGPEPCYSIGVCLIDVLLFYTLYKSNPRLVKVLFSRFTCVYVESTSTFARWIVSWSLHLGCQRLASQIQPGPAPSLDQVMAKEDTLVVSL